MSWTFNYAGRIVDNVNTTALVNNTLKTVVVEVPAGKRWVVMGGMIENIDNVTRICQVIISNNADAIIFQIFYHSLATTIRGYFPMRHADLFRTANPQILILAAGQKIKFTWQAGGASAGGTTEYSLDVIEQDV